MNDNYTTAQTGRGSPLDAMGIGIGHRRVIQHRLEPLPNERRNNQAKGRGDQTLPGRKDKGRGRLSPGNQRHVSGSPSFPGRNLPHFAEPTTANKKTHKMIYFFNPERTSAVITALLILFLALTTRLPNKVHISAPVQYETATGEICSPGDVYRALDSGRAELEAARLRFDRAIKQKTTIVTPLGSEEQR